MRRRGVRFALVGLAVVAAVVVAELASGGGGETGRPAPALPRAVLVPPGVTLAGLRGRPAVVNFWASWCEPCRQEAPRLERLARSLRGRGRAGLVGVDWSDGLAGARAFVRRYGWSFPILRDPDGTVGNRYGLSGLPTSFVLDSRGRIVERLPGPQTESSLREALRAAS
jgi:cytochrome c biogenesis protein CcmG, thiol:disulfide interchange protein DsbE